LRKIFRPEMEEVIGDWRRLQSEELHGWYTSSNITRVIKQVKMKWVMRVAHEGEKSNGYKV
jgi:hypothetical protein